RTALKRLAGCLRWASNAEPHAPQDVWIPGRSEPRLCLRLDAHRHRRFTASAVSDRARLEGACHALAIGYSLRRRRLAPLAVTGSFACEGAAITADEKYGDRQHDGEDHARRRQPDDVHEAGAFQRSRDRARGTADEKHGMVRAARAPRIRASLSDRRTRGDVAAWPRDRAAAGEG